MRYLDLIRFINTTRLIISEDSQKWDKNEKIFIELIRSVLMQFLHGSRTADEAVVCLKDIEMEILNILQMTSDKRDKILSVARGDTV